MKIKLLGILFLLAGLNLTAFNFNSGFLTYQYQQGNQYKVVLQLVRDCRGIPFGGNLNLEVKDSNVNATLVMNRVSIEDVSWNMKGNCKPNQSSGFGVERHTFECVLDLDTILNGAFLNACKVYLGVSECCRIGSINTFFAGNAYLKCMMDRCLSAKNSGPIAGDLNQKIFGIGATTYFNPMIVDTIDNDILGFELTNPLNGYISPETYKLSYSPRYPLTPLCSQPGQLQCSVLPLSRPPRGLYYDSVNGNFIFTPTKVNEVGSIVYKVNEYRYISGIKSLIGFYYVEHYFYSQAYSGIPAPTVSKSTLKLNYNFVAGRAQTINFNTELDDTAMADSVIIRCLNPIKGSTVTINKKWRSDLTFTWQPECEDVREEPYLLYLYFFNENYYSTNPQSIVINVYVKSDLELGNDTVICKNGALNLKSNINGQYKWNHSTSDTLSYFVAKSPGTYFLSVDRNGCTLEDSIKLTELNQLPKVYLGNDTTICNQAIQSPINVSTQFEPYVKYRWNIDTLNPYAGLTFKDTGWVSVMGTNVCGSTFDSIHIARSESPMMKLPDDTLICDQQNFIIDPQVSGNGRYKWNNGRIDSAINVSSNAVYTLTYYNACATVEDSIAVDFLMTPKFSLGNDTIVCNESYPYFDLSPIVAEYHWSDGTKNPSYQMNSGGEIWVKASNQCGSKSDTVKVVSIRRPVGSLGRDTFICEPISLALSLNCESCQYKWNTKDTGNCILVSHAGKYWVQANNYCGNLADSIIVHSDTTPYFSFHSDTSFQSPFSYKLEPLTNTSGKYLWSTGDTSKSIQVNLPGLYWLTISNPCGFHKDSILISEETGINSSELMGVKLYPNPANDFVYIESVYKVEKVFIIGVDGSRFELNVQSDAGVYALDLKAFSSGVYMLEIYTTDQNYRRILSKG